MRHPLLLVLSPDLATEVAQALAAFRKHHVSRGGHVSPGYDDLLYGVVRMALRNPRPGAAPSGQPPAASPPPYDDGHAMRQYLPLDAAAARVGVSIRTLRRHRASGELAVVRIGRRVLVDPKELQRWLQSRTAR